MQKPKHLYLETILTFSYIKQEKIMWGKSMVFQEGKVMPGRGLD